MAEKTVTVKIEDLPRVKALLEEAQRQIGEASQLRLQLREWAMVLARGTGDLPAVDVAWKIRSILGDVSAGEYAPSVARGDNQEESEPRDLGGQQ